jgi:tetratricopeptide (TPR) repeat protein
MEIVKQHPFTGVGANNLKVNFALFQARVREKNNLPVRGTSESNVHNEYCQAAAETGFVGLIAFWLLLIMYFVQTDSLANTPYSAAVGGFALFSLSNFPLHIVPTALLTFVAMGLAAKKNSQPAPKAKIWLNVVVILAILMANYRLVIRPFAADYYRYLGDEKRDRRDFPRAIFYYQKSIELDREHSEKTAYDLGEIYRALGDWRQAIRAYQVAISLRNYAELYNNIGNCYYLLNEPRLALANWQMAYRLKMPSDKDQEVIEKNIAQVRSKQ